MMDPVLAIIIASCMTLTQFALQLRENISTSAYLQDFKLMLEAVQSIHAFLESTKKFKSWGSATDSAKKAFQKLEDSMRKCTGLLQRCINARSKLMQLVSEHGLKKEDFERMCAELDGVLGEVPTDTMPEMLREQLAKVREQLQTMPFVEAISPQMALLFERLVKDELAGGSRRAGGGGGGAPSGLPKFAAGQLAQQLGFEGPSSFRREQEALALERRKAVEGRDKGQEVVLEQVALVLVRMERELPPYLEIQKLKASALALPNFKMPSSASTDSRAAAKPRVVVEPGDGGTRRVGEQQQPPQQQHLGGTRGGAATPPPQSLVAAMEEQLTLKEPPPGGREGRASTGRRGGVAEGGGADGGSGPSSPSARQRPTDRAEAARRRVGAAAGSPGPPSFHNWVPEKGSSSPPSSGDVSNGAPPSAVEQNSSQQQQQQQQQSQSRFAPGAEAARTGKGGPEMPLDAAEMRSPRPRPSGGQHRPQAEQVAAASGHHRGVERSREEKSPLGATGGGRDVGTAGGPITPHPPAHGTSSSPSGRPRPRGLEGPLTPRGEESGRSVGEEGKEELLRAGQAGGDRRGDGVGQISLSRDMEPETDLAAYDPEAPLQVVQGLLFGTPEEQFHAAGLVTWYTTFSTANRTTFREAGAVDALLPLATGQDTKAAEAAVGALLNLSSDEESRRELLGHLPELVRCVKRAETPAARQGAANVLRSVAYTNEARASAVDSGVVPYLVKLLGADDISKQAAAEALASLAKCESRRSTIVIQGAVMPLALALRSNPVPETLTAICSSLASLAAVPEGREAMGLGVPSLVNVLRLEFPDALKDAVEALLLLARHSPTYRSSIRNNGGMRYLRNVLRSGPPSLHPKAMELLAALFS